MPDWTEADQAILDHYLNHLPETRAHEGGLRQTVTEECEYRSAAMHWAEITAAWVRQAQEAQIRYRSMRRGSVVLMLAIVGLLIWGIAGWWK